MSGIEVAGLVLGAIPLVIAALDNYKTTRQRFKYFVGKELYINRLIEALKEQKFFIDTELRVALGAAGLTPDDINTLILTPDASLFGDPDVVNAVQEYLGEGFPLYENAVFRCHDALTELVNNIQGLTSDSQVSHQFITTPRCCPILTHVTS